MEAPTFIDVFENVIPPDVCEDIIRRFEEDKEHQFAGNVGDGAMKRVDNSIKVCTEITITGYSHWTDIDKIFCESVGSTLGVLGDKYPGLAGAGSEVEDEGYRIKRYLANGIDKFDPHSDVGGLGNCHRLLIFIWYLNDVEEGGETKFPVHGITVKPKQGRLVTFPPFWTHLHQGMPAISGPKYTVGGWLNYPKPPTPERNPRVITYE